MSNCSSSVQGPDSTILSSSGCPNSRPLMLMFADLLLWPMLQLLTFRQETQVVLSEFHPSQHCAEMRMRPHIAQRRHSNRYIFKVCGFASPKLVPRFW